MANLCLNVDITEVYSPKRINAACQRFGLVPGDSMDILTGFDFDKAEGRRKAFTRIQESKPYLLVGSPPCTFFSALARWNLMTHKGKQGYKDWFDAEYLKARRHVEFCCSLYKYQVQNGRHFLHEHPWSAGSWSPDCVKDNASIPGVRTVRGDMCRHGMATYIDKKGG